MIKYILTIIVTIIAVVVVLNYNDKSVSCSIVDDTDSALNIEINGKDYRITAPEIKEGQPDAN